MTWLSPNRDFGLRIASKLSILIFFLFFESGNALAQAPVCRPKEATTEFGRWFDDGAALSRTYASHRANPGFGPTYSSLKLFFTIRSGGDKSWYVVVRDLDYHVLASFGPSDFSPDATTRWTGRLSKGVVLVDLVASATSDIVVELTSGIAYPLETTDVRLFSSQQATPRWDALYSVSNAVMKRAGDTVGMLATATYDTDGIKRSWCCSGVMIASDIFMTNWHCGGSLGMSSSSYWNKDVCRNAIVDLSYDDSKLSRQYSCEEVLKPDKDLDIAFLRVKPTLGVSASVGQPPQARISLGKPAQVFVVHHALCRPKLVSACSLVATVGDQGPTLQHYCDTEPGASGAPIFDYDGRLVGLHHSGFDRDAACNALDNKNKGTKASAIVKYLEEQLRPVYDRIQKE